MNTYINILSTTKLKSIFVNCRNALASDCLGNQFVMFEDMPAFWDGWDLNYYHLEKRFGLLNSLSK